MHKITMITLAVSILTATAAHAGTHYYNATNPKLGPVPHCSEGSMTLQDNGWLVSDDNSLRQDFHALMADPKIDGVPDAIYNTVRPNQSIQVCQNGGRLRYSIR